MTRSGLPNWGVRAMIEAYPLEKGCRSVCPYEERRRGASRRVDDVNEPPMSNEPVIPGTRFRRPGFE